jgi:hypothetical protein
LSIFDMGITQFPLRMLSLVYKSYHSPHQFKRHPAPFTLLYSSVMSLSLVTSLGVSFSSRPKVCVLPVWIRTFSLVSKRMALKKHCHHIISRDDFKNKSLTISLLGKGIKRERSAAYNQTQKAPSERSGKGINNIGGAIRIEPKFPTNLWPEYVKAAVYSLNMWPTRRLNWKTPYEMETCCKPQVFHLERYGSRPYPLIYNIPKLDKLAARAMIGYFVGYDSSNIFRIWIPSKGRVVRTRDVSFDPTKLYVPQDIDLGYAIDIEEAIRVIPPLPALSDGIEEICLTWRAFHKIIYELYTPTIKNPLPSPHRMIMPSRPNRPKMDNFRLHREHHQPQAMRHRHNHRTSPRSSRLSCKALLGRQAPLAPRRSLRNTRVLERTLTKVK